MRAKDITGQRFGRLTVLRRSGSTPGGRVAWLCKCACGRTKRIRGDSLRGGVTQSCGCLNVEATKRSNIKHGMSKTSIYRTWKKLMWKCYNRNCSYFEWYGGRGVTVCKRWHKFEDFYADMGDRPKGMTIDRIDNSKGYSSSNCRWASWRTQGNNRRSNRLLTFQGKTQTMAQWSREIGILQVTLHARLSKLGWSIERALTEPINEA